MAGIFFCKAFTGPRMPGRERDGAKKTWYRIIHENAATIKAAGFTWVWFPPASDSLAPGRLYPQKMECAELRFWHRGRTPGGD